MRVMICSCLSVLFVGVARAELPELPISDTRLSVSSLVREDIFAGWRSNDMERFARAEKNIELLLEQRPDRKGEILAWKGGTKLYRAVLAFESENAEAFEQIYQETLDLYVQARAAEPQQAVVFAVTAGGYVMFGDRLPEKYHDQIWSDCYDGYHKLWTVQSPYLKNLPLHVRGELLSGLILSTQRLGKEKEFDTFLDKAIEVLPGSSYATVAKRWKEDPQVAATENISCKGCHGPGRLSRRIKQLAAN